MFSFGLCNCRLAYTRPWSTQAKMMKLFDSENSAKARTFRENLLLCAVIQAWYRLISEIEVPVKIIFRLLSIKKSIVIDSIR